MTWLAAAGWGWVASLGLIAGALAGVYGPLAHPGISRVMAMGAGVLLAAASLDLIVRAGAAAGPMQTAGALSLGAGAFSAANAWLARRGARDRKRCGECVQQPTEAANPGSGLAIAMGTMLDSVPEGIVLGLETARSGAPGLAVVLAFGLGNFPEALSGSAGMREAGRTRRYVFGLWITACVVASASAALSAALFSGMRPAAEGCLNAFAAGALLSLTVETMVPEAAHGSGPFTGLIAAAGFVALLLLLSL